MAAIYLRRINEGLMTLADVPRYWQEAVRALLERQNMGE